MILKFCWFLYNFNLPVKQKAWFYISKERAASKVVSLVAFFDAKEVFFKENLGCKLDDSQHLRARIYLETRSYVVAEFFPEFDLADAALVHPREFEPKENYLVVEVFISFYKFYRVDLLISLFLYNALVLFLELTYEIFVQLVNDRCKITGNRILLVESLHLLQLSRFVVYFEADFIQKLFLKLDAAFIALILCAARFLIADCEQGFAIAFL